MSRAAKSPRHAHPRAPLRPEDATLVHDIETLMDLNARFADLSRDEHLEMVVLAGRAIARLQAIKQEALAHLHARPVPAARNRPSQPRLLAGG
jgi:hypothetical protein